MKQYLHLAFGLLLCVAMASCRSPRAHTDPAASPPATLPGVLDELRTFRMQQQALDAEIARLRDEIYQSAITLKSIRDRLESAASQSTALVAQVVSLEARLREAETNVEALISQEIADLRAALRREQEHQARLRTILAEREKEVRDLRSALRDQEAALRRLPAPAGSAAFTETPLPGALSPGIAESRPSRPAVEEAADTQSVFRLVAEGQRALREGNLERAYERFQAALAQKPGLSSALLGMAAVAYQADEIDEARRYVNEVLDADPRNAQALGLRGIIRWREGDTRAALRDCERAVDLDPRDPLLRKFYGITLNARGRTDDAIREMRKAVELDPSDAEAKINLAILLASGRRSDLEEARRFYMEAVAAGAAPDPELERLFRASSPLVVP